MIHPPQKSVRLPVCTRVRLILVLVWKKLSWFQCGVPASAWYQRKKKNAWYQRVLRCQLQGRPFHPWAGRLRFTGEAHPGPATFTQSSSFSCGAGLQSESRMLLCCAPVSYTHLRAHETVLDLVCRLLLEKKKERLVPASASLPTAGSALPPVGRATPLLW